MKNLKISMLLLLLLFSYLAATAQTTWRVDAAHSKVQFTISHMVISEVTGRFKDFDVTITNTGNDFANSKVNAIIKTASISTDNDKRDVHLKSGDFFDAEKFPEITFVSKSFVKTEKDVYKITGDLTMHGITKSVVLNAKLSGEMKDPWGNSMSAFKATTSLSRKDFGIVWNKTLEAGGFLVGENVDITINLEMQKEKK
jgi:polyisoprenoid-binding protein YceI